MCMQAIKDATPDLLGACRRRIIADKQSIWPLLLMNITHCIFNAFFVYHVLVLRNKDPDSEIIRI